MSASLPSHVAVTAMLAALAAIAVGAASGPINFDKDEVGKPPSGFSFALTGQGKPGVWVIQKDDTSHANVLVQTDADKTNYRFPLASTTTSLAPTCRCQ